MARVTPLITKRAIHSTLSSRNGRQRTVIVYMYATADTPAEAAAQNFIDITEMCRRGFFSKDSTVWMNADAPEAGMWTLNTKSTYLKVFRSVYPGWVRLTRTSAKWGRTAQATTKDATPVLDLRNLPDDPKPSATIIVSHRDKETPVQVVADGSIQRSNGNGVFIFDPFTVVDLHRYSAPEVPIVPSSYEAAHAMINGAAIMSTTSTEEGAEFIRDHMDLFRIEIEDRDLEYLTKHMDGIEKYASIRTGQLVDGIKQAGINGQWSTDSII